jgi:hypothetical protein
MYMKKRVFWVLLVALIVGTVSVYLFRNKPTAQSENKEASLQSPVLKPSEMQAGKTPGSSGISWFNFTKEDNESKDADKEDIYKMFQADERGNLVLNQNTRHNIEQLYALNTKEELDEKLHKLSTVLPSSAYRQLVNLLDYFDNYLRDIKNIYHPEIAPSTVEQALEQLQGMHSLRVKHFGSDVAESFFSEDEKINRQLLELMLKDPDKNATMSEKAERAQKTLQQMQSKP